MATTFDQAREIALKANAPLWRDLKNRGEYMVAGYGYEDADAWLMVDGAKEMIEGGDYTFDVPDQPLTIIMKETGELFRVYYLEAEERLDAMTPVGEHPVDE